MKPIDPAGFEQKFRGDADPWNYAGSRFEARKRRVLLRACGAGSFARGLELACANGETTRRLAPLCLRLLAVDSSPSALAEAARRIGGKRRVTLRRAVLPEAMPRGPFDLIVVSEIAYYLSREALRRLSLSLPRALAPGGRIVVLHHLRRFDDAAQPPSLAQARLSRALGRSMRKDFDERHGRFAAVAFRKPRRGLKSSDNRRRGRCGGPDARL